MSAVKTVQTILETYAYRPVENWLDQRYSHTDKYSYLDGVKPGSPLTDELRDQINKIVTDTDPDGIWHRYYNHRANLHKDFADDKLIPLTQAQAEVLLTRQLAQDELDAKVAEFTTALGEAEAIANKHGLTFSIYPTYGMGGSYDGEEGEWSSSSSNC